MKWVADPPIRRSADRTAPPQPPTQAVMYHLLPPRFTALFCRPVLLTAETRSLAGEVADSPRMRHWTHGALCGTKLDPGDRSRQNRGSATLAGQSLRNGRWMPQAVGPAGE